MLNRNDNEIDIKGLDKAEILAALYNNSKVQGMGFFGQRALGAKSGQEMTVDEARKLLAAFKDNERIYFDYLHGKVMKVNLSGDELDPWGYDRDNGQGVARTVIEQIRKGADKEFLQLQEQRLNKAKEEMKQDADEVIKKCELKITVISQPKATATYLGKESELTDKEFSKVQVDVDLDGKIRNFPHLSSDKKLVCAFNQWGMEGMAKIYECHSKENMESLFDSYRQGYAITIDWYAMSDRKLENVRESTATLPSVGMRLG